MIMNIKMRKVFCIIILLLTIGSNTFFSQNKSNSQSTSSNQKKKSLIFGPKSAGKIKDLFFTNKGFKLPGKILSINSIATYTEVNSIEGSGNVYFWDFTNSFQISAISEGEGERGNNDKISLVSFNYGGIGSIELANTIILNKSTLNSIEKQYPKRLIKFNNSNLPTYKIKDGKIFATFYFNEKNILISLSISDYDLEF